MGQNQHQGDSAASAEANGGSKSNGSSPPTTTKRRRPQQISAYSWEDYGEEVRLTFRQSDWEWAKVEAEEIGVEWGPRRFRMSIDSRYKLIFYFERRAKSHLELKGRVGRSFSLLAGRLVALPIAAGVVVILFEHVGGAVYHLVSAIFGVGRGHRFRSGLSRIRCSRSICAACCVGGTPRTIVAANVQQM